MATLYDLISANKRRTYLFIFLFSLILGVVGYFVVTLLDFGVFGYVVFAMFIIFYNLVTYYNSDKIVLFSTGARLADRERYKMLHNIVEEVSIAAGIKKPKVYIIFDDAPNAFATGRNPEHAAIVVTSGLLNMMNRDELQGVIAHEIAHIRNNDILLMTVVAVLGGLFILLKDMLLRGGMFFRRRRNQGILFIVGVVLAILAPLFIMLIRAAISRQREYLADATGAYIVRNPYGLSSALEKLLVYGKKIERASQATAHLFIANPFGQDKRIRTNLFSTHPPLELRIERLRKMII